MVLSSSPHDQESEQSDYTFTRVTRVSSLRAPAVSKSAASVAMVTFGLSHVSINVTWLDAKGTSTAISAEQ